MPVNFDAIFPEMDHHFVKSNPTMLKRMFGTTAVMPLWIADMDFKVAEPISADIRRMAERGMYAYEFPNSLVYKQICAWMNRRHGLSLKSGQFIQMPSALSAIALLIRMFSQKGEGVLIQTPVYHQFAKAIASAGRKVVENPMKLKDGRYVMDFEDLEAKLKSGDVKILLLCSPHNPGGRVWTREEVFKLKELARASKALLISDEIHSDIIYGGRSFTSVLHGEDAGHITLLGSPAKTFGMQSIANGYLVIPEEGLRKKVEDEVEACYLGHGNAISNYATIAAYKEGEPWLNDLIAYLEGTLEWCEAYVKENLPLFDYMAPEGTYQLWLGFHRLGLSKEELNNLIFRTAGLGLAPGGWFGQDGEGYYRLTFASPRSQIQLAFEKLKAASDISGIQ